MGMTRSRVTPKSAWHAETAGMREPKTERPCTQRAMGDVDVLAHNISLGWDTYIMTDSYDKIP